MSVSDQPTNEVISEVKQDAQVSNEQSNKMPTAQELMKQLEDFKSTNARLLDENYKTKQKFKEVRDKWEEMEQVRKEKLTAEERVKEMENELIQKQQLIEQREANLFESNVKSMIGSIAKDAYNVESLIAMKQYKDLLELDVDGINVTLESAESFVNTLREKEPYLFKKQSIPSMETGGPKREAPSIDVNEKIANGVSIKSLSTQELREYLKNNYKVS